MNPEHIKPGDRFELLASGSVKRTVDVTKNLGEYIVVHDPTTGRSTPIQSREFHAEPGRRSGYRLIAAEAIPDDHVIRLHGTGRANVDRERFMSLGIEGLALLLLEIEAARDCVMARFNVMRHENRDAGERSEAASIQ